MTPTPFRAAAVTALALALLLAGCGADAADPEPAAAPAPGTDTVTAVLGDVELELEVADEPQERATGLMGRAEVPAGTGMVFLFDEPSTSRFFMFDVPVPLTAAFVRDGVVVGVEQMPPCAESEPSACPTYGPDEPYDTVVETAPETLPDVAPGDVLELSGS